MDEVAFLERLIAIPSPSGDEGPLAKYLMQQLDTMGFRAHRDAVGNIVGVVGPPRAERTIVLLGHMDTVPGHIPVRRQGDLLYGRGAVDAKGPLAAFVLAAARVAEHLDDTQIVVVGAIEEEAHSRGGRYLAQTMPPPTCAVIGEPSSWQGITLGYKGVLGVAYRLVQPAGHSAGEQVGPAERAVAFWNQLAAHTATFNEGRSRRFDALDPALREIRTFGDGLDEGVEMQITLRLPPDYDVTALQQRLVGWGDEAELSFPDSAPAFRVEKNTLPVRALLRAIRAEGGRPRLKLKTGTSDMNVVGPAWGCPIVAYGPGDASLDHTPQEHIDVHEFRRGINVLARALQTLAH